MSVQKQTEFLQRLEKEAKLQSSLHRSHLLPQWAQGLARVVAAYPWQVVLVLSGITAIGMELLR
jgi:hypothetical protein